MKRSARFHAFMAVALCCAGALTQEIQAQSPTVPPPNLKVAFLGGQGFGDNARAVLHLIKTEGAQAVIHQGDLDYDHNPSGWDQMISDSLGLNFPYLVSIGDAESNEWDGAGGYQTKIEARLQRIGIPWNGTLGLKSSLYFQGLFIILSGVDIRETGHDLYIRDQLAVDNSIWRVCSWHKNMRLMQVANKVDETGWGVYEESRLGGAILATGHSHTYSRSHLMSSMQNQTVASTANELHIEKGKSFVFVHEIGGQGIRNQELSGNWWASIYTKTQNAVYGALFGVFHVDGQPNKARFYMKNLNGQIIDSFTVISHVNEQPGSPSLSLTSPNGGENWEIGTTHNITWSNSTFSAPVNLEYSGDGGLNWSTIAGNVANTGSYVWNVNAAASSQARVRVSEAADGDPNDASDNDFTLTNIPFAPANLSAAANSSTMITLNWNDNSNIESGFKIERKTGSGAFGEIATAAANANSFNDTGLNSSTQYTYQVRAYNANGNSSYSNTAGATTPGAGGSSNLALNKPATASSTNGSNAPALAVDGNTGTYWRSGSLGSSTVAWLRVDLQSEQNIARAVINWRSSYYARRYQIQISHDDLNWTTVYSDNAGNGGIDNVAFAATTARYIRLYTTRNNQSSERVNEFEVYSSTGAALQIFAAQETLAAPAELHQNHPNPFNAATRIYYSVLQETPITLKVYTLFGQEVATLVQRTLLPGDYSAIFNPADLPTGIYFAILEAGSFKRIRRLVFLK